MADSNFFPEYDNVEVEERIVDVPLSDKGVAIVAQLKVRSNFSDYVPPRDDKAERLAKHYSELFKCKVAPLTIRLSDRLTKMWVGPEKKTGGMPTLKDFVKMSIKNKDAFAELVAISGEESIGDDVEETVAQAQENFTEEELDGDE